MNILVTGGYGFIGSHFIRTALKERVNMVPQPAVVTT